MGGEEAEIRKERLELGSGQWPGNLHHLSSSPAQQDPLLLELGGGQEQEWAWGQLSREGPLASGSFLHPWLKSAIQGCCRAQNRVEGSWGRSPACFSVPETPRIKDSVAGSVGAENLGCGFKGG